MVMTGATAMMNNGAPNPNMMGGINPMMDMSGMGGMSMGPMGMGMNGDMSMQMQQGGPMMQEGPVQGPGTNPTQEQNVQMGMPDGYGSGGPGPGMMSMGMGGDFGMQACLFSQAIYAADLGITGTQSNGPADVPWLGR